MYICYEQYMYVSHIAMSGFGTISIFNLFFFFFISPTRTCNFFESEINKSLSY